MKIPNKFKLFNHEISVIMDENLQSLTDNWGTCSFRSKLLKIDSKISKDFQEQTFLHELIHIIFFYLGEKELAENEKLVNSFSELLYQAIETFEYDEKRKNDNK